MHDTPDDSSTVADAILAYLESHPNAVDSATGIATWWLGTGPHNPASVQQALEQLAEQGLIARFHFADETVLYGRHPDRAFH